jgi:hypothetical protein
MSDLKYFWGFGELSESTKNQQKYRIQVRFYLLQPYRAPHPRQGQWHKKILWGKTEKHTSSQPKI